MPGNQQEGTTPMMIPRSKAGLVDRTGIALYKRTPADVTEFIVHWDGGKTPTTAAEELSLLQSYDRYHASNGCGGIGYTLAVGPVTGNVYEARGLDRVGAHTTGHNTAGVGVIVIGGPGHLTDKAKDGLREAYRIACDWAGKPALTIHGHLDLGDTDCPGPETYAWLKAGGITNTTSEGTTMANYTTYQGHKIAPGTLAAFKTMAAAFKKATGLDLLITDGYRTYAEQKSLYDRWKAGTFSAPSVAKPGTSLHETGRALDLRDSGSTPGVTVAGNSRSNWLKANAPAYGFKASGYSFSEPWHYEYQGEPWNAGSTATGAAAPTYAKGYIKDIQTRLIALGYSVGKSGADDSRGPDTITAIKAFQKDRGLTVDGLPGPDTLAALTAAQAVNITGIQEAVGANADNKPGPDTRKRVDAVRKASAFGGGKHPYGVKYTQGVVRTTADGDWKAKSIAAHDAAVYRIQKAVGANPDMKWGADTDKRVTNAIGK